MTFDDLRLMFNRAISYCFNLKKILFVFSLLALCGLLMVSFRVFSIGAGCWAGICLFFLSFFLSLSLLLSGGILIVRMYHDEIKRHEFKWKEAIQRSWDIMLSAGYFSIPLILAYLIVWMGAGVFALMNTIPYIGSFLSVILAFGPFLLHFAALVLAFLGVVMVYFLPPIFALRGADRHQVTRIAAEKISQDLFFHLVCFFMALIPMILTGLALWIAASMTSWMMAPLIHPLERGLYGFFVMVPAAFLFAPSLIFFFNFSTEAHVFSMKNYHKAAKSSSSP